MKETGAFYEPYQEEGFVDLFGIRSVIYNGTESQWNQLLEDNKVCNAFVNVKKLVCLGGTGIAEPDSKLSGSIKVESEWNTGCNITFTITNKGDKAVTGWKAAFKTNDKIESIWNASILNKENGVYEIKNADYNGTIMSGETVSFGFILNGANEKLDKLSNITVTEF